MNGQLLSIWPDHSSTMVLVRAPVDLPSTSIYLLSILWITVHIN